MHDRRAAGAEGLLACPFLALAGDRDIRLDAPDRRHRCHAETEPAPRAIAHQHEYCLSPAFAACPTFQDWARREAARVIGAGDAAAAPGAAQAEAEGPAVPPAPATPADEPVTWRADDAPSREPRDVRSEPTLWGDGRAWATPPPWLGPLDDAASSRWESEPAAARSGSDHARTPDADVDAPEATRPDGPAATPRMATPAAPSAGTARTRSTGESDLPAFLARRRPPAALDRPSAREPWSGGPADLADMPQDARAAAANRVAPARPSPDLRPDGTPRPGRAVRPEAVLPAAGDEAGADAPRGGIGLDSLVARRGAATRGGDGAPDWERPLRRESYPSLHMPVGLPHIPRVWLGAVALLVAAFVLFLAPTVLPGFFGAQPAVTPTPVPSVAPSISIAPTPPPLPTPFVYTVVQGDTLSGIATRNGLTIAELLKANPQIKNENKLAIGDRVTIPVNGASAGGTGASAAPSGAAAP